VINLLPVHFVADEIVGLPLKSNSNPRGAHREQELYELFANVANYVLLNFEPVNDWHLRESALGAAEKVIGYVKGHLTKLTNGVLSVDGFSDSVIHWVAGGNDQSDAFDGVDKG
jgi:prostaglandin-endoperoxide synthase 2